ncbi:MAG: AMP-binding protein [Ectothiorhodospiraceae bacterium]|nr:AMP-binding protein [Ectothiorhodospiraceae bacterium]
MKVNFFNHFEALVSRFGDNEALVNIDNNRRYTYKEFHFLTNKIANAIYHELGLRKDDVYMSILENDNLSLLHFPTIFKTPATCALTNYRDSLEEHGWQMERAHVKVVFVEKTLLATHLEMFRDRGLTVVCMDDPLPEHEGVLYFWDLVNAASTENLDIALDDRDHCAVIRFTGGTTGRGKPAMYSIDNWLNVRDTAFALDDKVWAPDARLLHVAPISHGSGMLTIPAFYSGATNITQNQPDLGVYCENIDREAVTHGMLVPTLLYRLLESESDLSTLRYMFYGAAPMSPSKLQDLQKRFGNIFIQLYGSTEHFAFATSLGTKDHLVGEGEDAARLASAGKITPGVELLVMDDNGRQVRAGEKGELWMRSRSTCLGYLDDPEKTKEEFVDGFWKSGDIGYIDSQGYVYIVDRKKDMIISGGFNIYANEVEAAVSSHEAVMMAAVVGVPHEEWGEAVHAEVVLKKGFQVTEDELKNHVKQRIGKYKSPKSIAFVDELPLSPVGKILRREVRDKYWSQGRKVG